MHRKKRAFHEEISYVRKKETLGWEKVRVRSGKKRLLGWKESDFHREKEKIKKEKIAI